MRVSLMQKDIVWEDKKSNLDYYTEQINNLKDKTDLVILPEMCTTGFSMNPEKQAEYENGNTVNILKDAAARNNTAICGSFIVKEGDNFYNRCYFFTPGGDLYKYNKRHLYSMGYEDAGYTPGKERTIIKYKGWNILPVICYDIRFPVWIRNKNNEYDLIVVMANWPEKRIQTWDILLQARAIENQAYLCGVNRIGEDGNGVAHTGHSKIIDPRGTILASLPGNKELVETYEIKKEPLVKDKEKFTAWHDADNFSLII